MKTVIACLMFVALTAVEAAEPKAPVRAPLGAATTPVIVEEEPQDSSLQEMVATRTDFVDRGDVLLLNNGVVLVTRGGQVYRNANGNLAFTHKEVVVLQTLDAMPTEGPLYSVMEFRNCEFDIQWNVALSEGEALNGLLVITRANGLSVEMELGELSQEVVGGGACNITCPGEGDQPGASCSNTCPEGKACISYCYGPGRKTPACECVDPPKVSD